MIDPFMLVLGLFLGSYMSSYGSSYMPPPADDILGYYYYDNGSLMRIRKNTNIFDNSKKRRNYFPFAFGNTKTSLYSSQLQSDTIIYEYTIVCLAAYLCMTKNRTIFHDEALITEVRLEHITVISSANVFSFIFVGIPLTSLPNSLKEKMQSEDVKNNE